MVGSGPGFRGRFAAVAKGGALAAALLVTVASGSAPAAPAAEPSFFRTVETKNTNLAPFKKWTGALERFTKEVAATKTGSCSQKELNKCNFDKWIGFLKTLQGKDKGTQIQMVNAQMNKANYITDPVNWGVKDFWATPGEFMAKFGDCEDYAIIKYMSLRHLGFSDDQMRVVAVKDLNLKVGHAVLVVFLDGNTYVLDNQIKQVIPADKVLHYQPVFSINQSAWWRHRPA